MSHQILKSYLEQVHDVPDEMMNEYISHWQEFKVSKKHILTHQGQTQKYMYFVLDGLQKSYYLNEGKEHVIAFTYVPSFSGIPESFLTQTPSKYFLETISDSHFLKLSYEQHQNLMLKYRPIETLFRKATELLLIGLVERHYELMAFNIENRFRSFLQRSPHLLNQVPHKDLASYLRINPTNFSKLLNRIQV